MKFRCPYCKHVYGPDPLNTCPACGRTMMVPDILRPDAQKKTAHGPRERSSRFDVEPGGLFAPMGPFGRKPSTMLIVMSVMVVVGGLLLSRVDWKVQQSSRQSRPATAIRELNILSVALERFRADCGRYPTEDEGLSALLLDPGCESWDGPYVTLLHPDPWRQPYRYRRTDGEAVVFSSGADQQAGTADDLWADSYAGD